MSQEELAIKIGRIILDERDPKSNDKSSEMRVLEDTFNANNQPSSTKIAVYL